MGKRIRPSAITNVEVVNTLFGQYADLVADRIIPYQWDILNARIEDAEKSWCVENFRIAAGEKTGRHNGTFFGDTDAYKWLETVAFCIENHTGAAYKPVADGLIELISRAQQPDGYLNTYYTIEHPDKCWTNLLEGHEMYGAGHLIEAGVAWYRATGERSLLDIGVRFADLIADEFGPDGKQREGYPGHPEVELALVKLYEVTGNERYLRLARHFVAVRGREPNYFVNEWNANEGNHIFLWDRYDATYAQAHMPPDMQDTAEGHAVRAMYLFSAMADISERCGDAALLAACERLWQNTTQRRMYITGGIGSSACFERFTTDYDLPNDRMYCESCASVGLMMFGQRMAALTGEASYYDEVERALCNTVLGGISMTGDRYFYVNPLEVWPDACMPFTSMEHVKPVRQRWFDVACCPTNIARTLASLGSYIFSEDGESLFVNLLISSRIRTRVGGGELSLSLHSSFMQDGKVRMEAEKEGAEPACIRLRVPSYYAMKGITIDGKAVSPEVERGYTVIPLPGRGRFVIEMEGAVVPRFFSANEEVRADVGKVAMMFGPYVYCLEETDNGANLANVFVSPDSAIETAPPEASLPGGLPTLSFDGLRLVRSVVEEGALYGTPKFETSPVRLRAVPYCLWGNRAPGEMVVWMKALV
ncbi:MAG: glycoside hydrolase family 127 protein [Clostridiales Family XIII bacterium]|nr:glycoside hydrolase family 127 protein [Clostridiales Family XIII bacterium]